MYQFIFYVRIYFYDYSWWICIYIYIAIIYGLLIYVDGKLRGDINISKSHYSQLTGVYLTFGFVGIIYAQFLDLGCLRWFVPFPRENPPLNLQQIQVNGIVNQLITRDEGALNGWRRSCWKMYLFRMVDFQLSSSETVNLVWMDMDLIWFDHIDLTVGWDVIFVDQG